MTISISPRFGLTLWNDDDDQLTREQFTINFSAIEALGVVATAGPLSQRPPAGEENRFYYAEDTGTLFFDVVTAWQQVLFTPDFEFTAGSRPAPGVDGRYVYETDARRVFRDAGSRYVELITSTVLPAGIVMPTAAPRVPPGWLFCDGTPYNPGDYPDLFAAIGTRYGSAGAQFKVPDYRGNFLAGAYGPGVVSSGQIGDHDHGGNGGHHHDLSVVVPFADHTHAYRQPVTTGGDQLTGGAQDGAAQTGYASTTTNPPGGSGPLFSYESIAWLIKATGGPHD